LEKRSPVGLVKVLARPQGKEKEIDPEDRVNVLVKRVGTLKKAERGRAADSSEEEQSRTSEKFKEEKKRKRGV